jgi:hypothetical protein
MWLYYYHYQYSIQFHFVNLLVLNLIKNPIYQMIKSNDYHYYLSYLSNQNSIFLNIQFHLHLNQYFLQFSNPILYLNLHLLLQSHCLNYYQVGLINSILTILFHYYLKCQFLVWYPVTHLVNIILHHLLWILHPNMMFV